MRWLAIVVVAACAHEDATKVLHAQTQALLDAVAVGDKRLWERYLDPRATYVSENATIDSRETLLPQIEPLPAGITGKIVIDKFVVQQFGGTAVVVYNAKESETYFGQQLSAEYLMTDTWRRVGGAWRLVMSHVAVKLSDPPAIEVAVDDYVGSYRLAEQRYVIRREGAGLVGERAGRAAQPLRVEVRDVLFVPGQPRSRKVFVRDGAGHVTGFRDRREGHDLVWERLPD